MYTITSYIHRYYLGRIPFNHVHPQWSMYHYRCSSCSIFIIAPDLNYTSHIDITCRRKLQKTSDANSATTFVKVDFNIDPFKQKYKLKYVYSAQV
jgi:hypothetical protein